MCLRRFSQSLVLVGLASGCGGSSAPTAPTLTSTPVPIPTAPVVSAQDKSNWLQAIFFNTGPDGGAGSCSGGVDPKIMWSDSVRVVDVIFSPRATAQQRGSVMQPLAQFNDIKGGLFTFNERVGQVSIVACKVGIPIAAQNCTSEVPSGQIWVGIEDDVPGACGVAGAVGCQSGTKMVSRFERGSTYIIFGPTVTAGAHELLHAMVGGCHPNPGSPTYSRSSIGSAGFQGRWTDADVAVLTDVARSGLLHGGVTQQEFRNAGLVF
jgi:hypothetical protein